MKVLLINKFYFNKGGSETVFFMTKQLLEEAGFEVVVFSMQDDRNEKTPYAKYFAQNIDFQKKESWWKELKKALRFVWSRDAKRQLARLIEDEKPDVANIHNFTHQLTPSILSVLKKNKIPVVQTLHDYTLINPNYSLYAEGKRCDLKKFRWYHMFKSPCPQDSWSRTFLAGFEFWFHRFFRTYKEKVDIFVTPSKFLKKTIEDLGIKKRIVVINNPIDLENLQPNYEVGDYAVCVTRFVPEKGVMTLIKAVRKVSDFKLKIVGDGPKFETAKKYIKEKQVKNVELVGRKSASEVYELVRNSRFLVIPSVWYENYPTVVLEAMALGKPVLGSDLGGIPEMVREGETGWLSQPNSIKLLRQTMKKAWYNEADIEKFGRNARAYVEKHNSPASYLQNLRNVL